MTLPTFSDVHVRLENHIGRVIFDRPPHNFFDAPLLENLKAAYQALEADRDCRVILLSSAGNVFCAGANFGSDGRGFNTEEAARIYAGALVLANARVPTVCAVQGAAMGGGFGVTLSADFRVAAPEARFHPNFAKLGLHAGFGITATLPRIVGGQTAMRMLLTSERVGGEAAAAMGLADRLAPREELEAAALAFAAEIASAAPLAVQGMLATLRAGKREAMEAAITRELEQQGVNLASHDFREGVAAAAARRPPVFTGT